ncbi:hypothetical protein [Halomonas koreensis]|uniref:Uncharacterized protein n=1 Tax=Halomonas koreensis TaxID=245385 RepID=A0ABU1G6M0_9GAMM|nr:hypothetical protein [Halomonas koreensis]MDR5868351.1 hypothetical protein [Halomonas koreensis]
MASLIAETGPSALAGEAPPAEVARPRPPERRHARWWLAGLLVGCLLPAGLASLEARPVERLIQVCILAPAWIRASSRLQARRRARRRWPPGRRPGAALRPLGHPVGGRPAGHRPVAAHDVLTRRGPPRARP